MSSPRNNTPCPYCGRLRPSAVIVDGCCDFCRVERARAKDREEYERRVKEGGWDSPAGDAIRQTRNNLLESWAWTVRPGSPLSAACQGAFIGFFAALHRLTIDYPSPAEVKVPDVPPLEYAERINE